MDSSTSHFVFRTKDNGSEEFLTLVDNLGFEEAAIHCWEYCQDRKELSENLKKQIDSDQYGPTALIELLGYGLQQEDSEWLFKYLVHKYYLTQESAWAASYQGLYHCVDVLQDYTEEQVRSLKICGQNYYEWYIRKREREKAKRY